MQPIISDIYLIMIIYYDSMQMYSTLFMLDPCENFTAHDHRVTVCKHTTAENELAVSSCPPAPLLSLCSSLSPSYAVKE